MRVGFAFERDIAIRQFPVAVLNQPEQEFDIIPEEKYQEQHLGLLADMDEFVVDENGIILDRFAGDDDERKKTETTGSFRHQEPDEQGAGNYPHVPKF